MNKYILLFMFSVLVITGIKSGNSQPMNWLKKEYEKYNIYYTRADSLTVSEIEAYLKEGMQTISAFFKAPFKQKIDVYIFPDRKTIDTQWQISFNDTGFRSQCWMVASGVAKRLDMISPLAWKNDACEHKASDKEALKKLLVHELTHVFHGQYNPIPDFTGMDDMSWLVEGLATYVSGQLDSNRTKDVKKLIAKNALPSELVKIWSGKAKYGSAGSLIKYVDVTYGRKKLFKLLTYTTPPQVLSKLKTTEPELISNWKKFLGKNLQ